MSLNNFQGAAYCMFRGINRCSRESFNHTRVVCQKHAMEIFGIVRKSIRAFNTDYSSYDQVYLVKNQSCKNEIPILPFPLKFISDATPGRFTSNGKKVCVDHIEITNTVTSFVNSKNLINAGYSDNNIQEVIQCIIMYISEENYTPTNNLYLGPNYTTLIQNYNGFNQMHKASLISYWQQSPAYLDVNTDVDIIKFPVHCLPSFYQAMLPGFEFSQHDYNNGQPSLYQIPNIMANVTNQLIHTFNQSVDVEIFKYSEDVDVASALIFMGSVTQKATLPYAPFQRPTVIQINQERSQRPPMCA